MTRKVSCWKGWSLTALLFWLLADISSFASAGPLAYVTNEKSDDISVIDTSSNTVVRTIQVGKRPRGVEISPDGRRVYIANGNSDSISVIAAETGKVVATWPAGVDPEGVALSPDGSRLFAVNENGGTVTGIDTTTGATVATLAVQVEPEWIAVSPDGRVWPTSRTRPRTPSL